MNAVYDKVAFEPNLQPSSQKSNALQTNIESVTTRRKIYVHVCQSSQSGRLAPPNYIRLCVYLSVCLSRFLAYIRGYYWLDFDKTL